MTEEAGGAVAIRLADPQGQLTGEIADPSVTLKSLTLTYALAMREPGRVDWPAVNRAIIARWSMRALGNVKAGALRMAEEKATAAAPETSNERNDQ